MGCARCLLHEALQISKTFLGVCKTSVRALRLCAAGSLAPFSFRADTSAKIRPIDNSG
jgi:hypothetical protein